MPKKIKLGLRELDICLKIQKARNIIASMHDNAKFPEPDPPLFEIEEAAMNLEQKYSEIRIERRLLQEKTMDLNRIETELDKKLTILAAYVESKAKGDVAIIHSAGMEVRANSVPVGIPARALIKTVKETANNGEVRVKWEKVKGAKIYNVELSDNIKNESSWKVYDSTTKTKEMIRNLKSGTKYWFRVQAIGSAGKGPYSEPVFKYAP